MITDVRVQHEYDVFKSAGAISIRVEAARKTRMNRGNLVGEDDITETGLDHIENWDYVIDNNSDYETLVKNAKKLIEEIQSKHM